MHPSHGLLMDLVSACKYRVRRMEAVEIGDERESSLRGNGVSACGISGLCQVRWDAWKVRDIDGDCWAPCGI